MSDSLSRSQLTVLVLALMATGIGQSLVFAILAPLGREVGMAEIQVTGIIAVSSFVYAAASPRWGRRSDRVGRKPVIITGLLGYALGTLLFASVFLVGLAGTVTGTLFFLLALAARGGQSAVMSATAPSATAYAADCAPPQRRTAAMASLGTANSMGMILGPAVSGALATLGLLAPLYFAGLLACGAALLVWKALPALPPTALRQRNPRRMRYLDPRIRRYALTAIALFTGFSAIQQTLGFQLQDKLLLDGVATAQFNGGALMVSALFTFLMQVTVMQRVKAPPRVFIRLGLVLLGIGGLIVSSFGSFTTLAFGMAFFGSGLGLAMPAITAGASLAVPPEEQGAAAGVIAACPAVGFVAGPVAGGLLYPLAPSGPALTGAAIFFITVAILALTSRS
uniref:Multidrug-efflux transporter n=1 Tax=Haliea sp. ETY-M TaxID=1055105 RepID=A0A455R1W0_9GAMM|nr:multidrug-efflux transporter [Haliea sp. ETY-M]